jgi:hypothetical protein
MAKRIFADEGFTPVGVGDGSNFTNLGFMALQGGSSTQVIQVSEVECSGLANSGAPTPLVFGRDSTVGATLTSLSTAESDGPLDPATAALGAPAQPFTQASTKPQRSASAAKLSCGINANGGLSRFVAYDEKDMFKLLGNTASLGELSLSAYTGGTPGLISAHIIYEPK